MPAIRRSRVRVSRWWALVLATVVLAGMPALIAEPADAVAWNSNGAEITLQHPQNPSIWSGNGLYELRMQTDGNLVLYSHASSPPYPLWASYTFGSQYRAKLQNDGNLVVYDRFWNPIYHTGSYGHPGSTWVLSDRGKLSVYNVSSVQLWTSGVGAAWGGSPAPSPGLFGYADDSLHRWSSEESTWSEEVEWIWRFRGPGGENAVEPTDLTFTETSSGITSTDVWWWVGPSPWPGAVWCSYVLTGPTCDRFYLKISDTFAPTASSHVQNNLVCHELGHTIAFGDGGTTSLSCLTGGMTATFSPTETNIINTRW